MKPLNKTGKIGLFFGSFNPITFGHISICKKALKHDLDEVWVFVSPNNPDKVFTGELAPEHHRWNMVNLALKNSVAHNQVFASNMEFFYNDTITITYKTIRDLKKDNPHADFLLICGTDVHLNIPDWHKSDWIIDNIKFLVFPRNKSEHQIPENKKLHNQSIYAPEKSEPISATDVRKAIFDLNFKESMTCKSVYDYIIKNNVYPTKEIKINNGKSN